MTFRDLMSSHATIDAASGSANLLKHVHSSPFGVSGDPAEVKGSRETLCRHFWESGQKSIIQSRYFFNETTNRELIAGEMIVAMVRGERLRTDIFLMS
jgi:hypothetical protein